ncbi:DUF1573 domain-containing protein [Bacteroides sp.]
MKYIAICIFVFCLFSCKNSKEHNIAELIKQWDEKEVIFPTTTTFSQSGLEIGEKLTKNTDFKILTYVDSIGCTSCKLQLPKWKVLIGELDSITNGNVGVLFFMHPKDRKEIDYILKRDNFDYPVCIDKLDSLNKLNHFPADERFQTFLLDKNNKVLAIGNPVHNPKVKELYMKIILGDKAPETKDKIKTTVAMETSLIGLGEFDWREEQKATFKLKNTGAQPLVIMDVTTSCGCISANFPKEPVASGSEAEITVVYKADKPEHFNKTVSVYCNAENSPFTMKVTGMAK